MQTEVCHLGTNLAHRRETVVDAVDDRMARRLDLCTAERHIREERVEEQHRRHRLVSLRAYLRDIAAGQSPVRQQVGRDAVAISRISQGAELTYFLEEYRLHAASKVTAPQPQSSPVCGRRHRRGLHVAAHDRLTRRRVVVDIHRVLHDGPEPDAARCPGQVNRVHGNIIF